MNHPEHPANPVQVGIEKYSSVSGVIGHGKTDKGTCRIQKAYRWVIFHGDSEPRADPTPSFTFDTSNRNCHAILRFLRVDPIRILHQT